jgi:hypothetical protein
MLQVASLTAAFLQIHRPLSASAKHATGIVPASHCQQAGDCLSRPCRIPFQKKSEDLSVSQPASVGAGHVNSEARTSRCGVILDS